jgi:hypothetical protein
MKVREDDMDTLDAREQRRLGDQPPRPGPGIEQQHIWPRGTYMHAVSRASVGSQPPVPRRRTSMCSDLALGRCLRAGVSRVRGPARLDQEDVRLLIGDRAVLDAARDDEDVALAELDVSVTEPDCQPPLEDEKEIVRFGVRVPDELALDLSDLDLVVVVVADDPRLEVLVEGRERLREIDGLVQRYSAGSIWAFWSRPE